MNIKLNIKGLKIVNMEKKSKNVPCKKKGISSWKGRFQNCTKEGRVWHPDLWRGGSGTLTFGGEGRADH